MVKRICEKHTADIKFNGRRLKAFLLRSGTNQALLFSSLLFNIVLEVLGGAIRKELKTSKLERRK